MTYEIRFENKASRIFDKLDNSIKKKIGKKIDELRFNPELGKRFSGNLHGLWKLKIEKWRIFYSIKKDKIIIYILDIKKRDKAY